jgi:putative membrane protein
MAWIRTAVSLVGFGFSIPHFFRYLHDAAAASKPLGHGPLYLGMMLIALGTGGLLGGTLEHLKLLRQLTPGRLSTEARSTVLLTALCLQAFGIFALLNVWAKH